MSTTIHRASEINDKYFALGLATLILDNVPTCADVSLSGLTLRLRDRAKQIAIRRPDYTHIVYAALLRIEPEIARLVRTGQLTTRRSPQSGAIFLRRVA